MKKIILIFLFVFLLSGCNSDIKTYEYVGESENWKAVYTYDVQYLKNGDNSIKETLKITYIGESEKMSIGTLIESTYEIESKSGSETLKVEGNSEPLEIINSSNGINNTTLQGDEIGKITISWNGKYEEFDIKNINN